MRGIKAARATRATMAPRPKENAMTQADVAKDKLLKDFNQVVADTEELLR